jgi:hypothetical protein
MIGIKQLCLSATQPRVAQPHSGLMQWRYLAALAILCVSTYTFASQDVPNLASPKNFDPVGS